MQTSMLRILSMLMALSSIIFTVQAQYLPTSFPFGSGNPNGFHRGDDIQNPMPGQGWTVIYNGSDTIPKWSSLITMPFPYWFNNELRSSLKVSNTGIITFDTSFVNIPKDTSISLPKSGYPNSAIYMLGLSSRQNQASIILNPSARTPMIRTRIFGFAPNRQFWISYTGFSFMHSTSQFTSICNWSIMLEESSNFVYVIDHSTFSFAISQNGIRPDTTNIGLSIGLQINDSTGVMLGQRVGSQVLNPRLGMQYDFTADDNAYHVFRPKDAIPRFDLSIASITLGELTAGSKNGIDIPVEVRNNGSDTVKSFRLRLDIENDTIIDSIHQSLLAPGASLQLRTAIWSPKQSKRYRLSAWCDSINENNPDEYSVNDTAKTITAYMVNPPKKNVLIEQFTSTNCGECPRGITAIDTALSVNPGALHIAYHLDDSLALNRADTLSASFATSAGAIMVDRGYYPNISSTLGFTLPRNSAFLEGKPIIDALQISKSAPTPAEVNINTVFHNPSRTLTCTITSTFEAEVSGDFRVNAMIVQDSIIGGLELDQANTMSGDSTIPIWGNQPQKISNFQHKHVARMFLDEAGIFGVPDSVASDTQIGKKYACTFTTVLPADMNIQTVTAIGFLYEYNPDPLFGRILNAASIPIKSVITNVQESISGSDFALFPQPANDFVTFQVHIPSGNSRIEVYSLLGDLVFGEDIQHSVDGQFIGSIDVSAFPSGIYSFRIKHGEYAQAQVLRVLR